MKIFVSLFLLLMIHQQTIAQIHEIGVLAGGSNYIGDIGATQYISPGDAAFGILYKWNLSERYSYRASIMQFAIEGMDSKSDIPARQDRNYTFRNTIREFSAGIEFNFLTFNLHDFSTVITPYLYSGLSYFSYNNMYFETDKALKYNTKYSFSIPMALGIKSNILNPIIIAAEVNVRYTFTDNLEGSNPSEDQFSTLRFGNLNSTDWYVFSGITITYTFGRNPCYCTH